MLGKARLDRMAEALGRRRYHVIARRQENEISCVGKLLFGEILISVTKPFLVTVLIMPGVELHCQVVMAMYESKDRGS